MKKIPVYKFYKHKYGDELLVDIVDYDIMRGPLQRTPVCSYTFFAITLVLEADETVAVCPQIDTEGLSYLVAYVVPHGRDFSLTSLKRNLSEHLTSFMIPEFFVTLPALPMTPNGKVDRKALPKVEKEGSLYA